MVLNRFVQILQNLHFAKNTQDNKTDHEFKKKKMIDRFNRRFSEVLSNVNEQSIEEHMVKFKG